MTALAAPTAPCIWRSLGGFERAQPGDALFLDRLAGQPPTPIALPTGPVRQPPRSAPGPPGAAGQLRSADFAATDRTSVYQAAAPLAMYFGQGWTSTERGGPQQKAGVGQAGWAGALPDAWAVFYLCALAHLLTAARRRGLCGQEALLTSFARRGPLCEKPCLRLDGLASFCWPEALGGNHRQGRRVLAETVQRLNECPASPWERWSPFSAACRNSRGRAAAEGCFKQRRTRCGKKTSATGPFRSGGLHSWSLASARSSSSISRSIRRTSGCVGVEIIPRRSSLICSQFSQFLYNFKLAI